MQLRRHSAKSPARVVSFEKQASRIGSVVRR